MRVLFLSHWVPNRFEYGGLYVFSREFLNALSSLGIEYVLASLAPVDGSTVWCGFNPGELEACSVEVSRMCSDVIGRFDVDAVFMNDYISMSCPLLLPDDVKVHAYFHTYSGCPLEFIGIAYSDYLYTNSKRMKSILDPLVRFVREYTDVWVGKKGMNEFKVVYPAPPTPPSNIDVKDLGFRGVTLCYVGRLQGHKNFNLFLDVVNALNTNALVISHDTVTKDFGRIKIYGNVSEGEKWSLLPNCTLGVVPSMFEPFGLVVLEFVKAGVPVVVSENVGASEVLPVKTFRPDSLSDCLSVIKSVLNDRDNYLNELRKSEIMRRTWVDVVREVFTSV